MHGIQLSKYLPAISIFIVIILLIIVGPQPTHSSEGGQSSYVSGLHDTMAGFQPPPGFYFQEKLIFYTANADKIVRNKQSVINLHQYLPAQLLIINQVTKTRILNSYYSWGMLIPFAEPKLSGQLVTPIGNITRSQSVSSIAEMEIAPIILGWHNGRSHQRAWFTIYIPTGKYSPQSLVYTSLNHWAIELDYAYTFLDPKTGWEFDAAPGYTFNTKNSATDYLSGQEFHIDYAAIKHLSNVGLGAVGFIFIQTTPDTGSGAMQGSFEGRAFGMGPIITYNTQLGSVPISLAGKYYQAFGVTNRFTGHSYWLNIGASF